jgi:hypothetical protein
MSFAGHYDMALTHHEDLAGIGAVFFLLFCLSPLFFVRLKGACERVLLATPCIVFAAICYSLAWNPWRARFFPFVFVPLAPLLAILADKYGVKFLAIPVSLLFCAAAFLTFQNDILKNFQNISLSFRNRNAVYEARNPYVFDNAAIFRKISGNAVILARENDPIYQYFVLMKQASLNVVSAEKYCGRSPSGELAQYIAAHNISTVIDMGESCGILEKYAPIFESHNDFSKIRIVSTGRS